MKILLKCHCTDGSDMYIAGNHPILGGWDPGSAMPMQLQVNGHDGSEWMASLDLEPGQTIEYKFLKKANGHVEWEAGYNRVCTAVPGIGSISDSFRS